MNRAALICVIVAAAFMACGHYLTTQAGLEPSALVALLCALGFASVGVWASITKRGIK